MRSNKLAMFAASSLLVPMTGSALAADLPPPYNNPHID
jgi:hypothetical protein